MRLWNEILIDEINAVRPSVWIYMIMYNQQFTISLLELK